jgi:hypothetical protein
MAYTFDAIKVDSLDLLTFLFSRISSFSFERKILLMISLFFLLKFVDLSSSGPKIYRKSLVVQMFAPLAFKFFSKA